MIQAADAGASPIFMYPLCARQNFALTTAGVDNVGKEGKQSSFVADVSETDCHGARNCRRVFWARMLD